MPNYIKFQKNTDEKDIFLSSDIKTLFQNYHDGVDYDEYFI